jgi:DNA polymerase III epsilon subunit-like protein
MKISNVYNKDIVKFNRIYNKYKLINIKEICKIDKIIILDIETTGLLDTDYIIQIAYNIYDTNMELIKKENLLINENVNKTDFFNLFSLDEIKKNGLDIIYVLNKLKYDLSKCRYIIGHNISFDIQKIQNYFKKFNIQYKMPKSICTMKRSKDILLLKNIKGYIKYPKLIELYKYYYRDEEVKGTLHDASCDIEITYLCFIKLIDNNIIKECIHDKEYKWL